MRIPKTCFFTLVLIFFTSMLPVHTVFAEQTAPATMDLNQAVQTALKENPQIKAGNWAVKAAKEGVSISKGYFYPSLSYESRFMRTDNPTFAFMAKLNQERFTQSDFNINSLNSPSPVNDFQNSLRLDQVIYSRRLIAGSRISKEENISEGLDFERLRQKVTMDTVQAYLAVITSRQYLDAANKALADTAEHERLAKLRYDSGLGLYSDVLRADSANKEAMKGVAGAQENYDIARRALGLATGGTISINASGLAYNMKLQPIDTYYNSTADRPDIKSIESGYKKAQSGIEFARAGYFPEVGASGQYQWNDHRSPIEGEGSSYMLTAFLRWNIFDGTIREHSISQARARMRQAQEGLEGAKKEASFRVFAAYQAVLTAQKSLDYATAELNSAREGRRLVELRYKNSLSPLIDVLDSQVMVEKARAGVIEAQNDLAGKYFVLGFESGRISEFINKASQNKE
ncbi:MAG: TolC family protein [Nitrospiraceae bacterium]|nr:TolC family protein [Nitrospiraceae bacterium]